jgi:transposase
MVQRVTQRDWRDDRIDELEQQLKAALAQNARLAQQLKGALERIAELEEKLGTSSRNSSKPPSSDSPKQQADRKKKAASITKRSSRNRKPGGQPGHQKFSRQLVPAAEVDHHHDCIPESCENCDAKLGDRDPSPQLHQVFKLPEVRPEVDQYALHAVECAGCGHVTRGCLPEGVPTGAFGPSVVAMVTMLIGVCRLGKRTVQQLLSDLFGLSISLGAIIGCQQLGSEALEAPVDEARQFVRHATVKHSDETSWRQGADRAKVWLWTVVTKRVTVFAIQRERSTDAAKTLLGKLGGVLVSDRYSAYSFWRPWMRQVCWSHLIRDFVAIAERGGTSTRIGDALLEEARRLFGWWNRVRDGDLSRERFQTYVRPLRKRVHALLTQGQACKQPKTARTCTKILQIFDALWLFVERVGVEPTNNPAERAVRHGVLWRKISGGTHSEKGSRFAERVLTVVATLRQQNRNILAFIRAACEAKLARTQSPSLLPE